MKCEGCTSSPRVRRDFLDDKGHSYGERLSGDGLFDREYDDSDYDYLKMGQEKADSEARLKAEREAAEKEAQLKAEKEAAEKAEAERLAAEQKNKKAAEDKKTAEDKKKAKEIAKKKAEEDKKKAADEKKKAELEAKQKVELAARQKAEEEAKKKADEEAKKKAANDKAAKEKEEADKIKSKLDEIAKRLENNSSDSEKQKLLDEGVALAKKLADSGSDNDTAHYILSQDAQKKKDYYKALSELEKAIALNESNYLYYYDMGKLQYLLRRYNDAKASFIRSYELNDHFSPSIYNLGLTYVKLTSDSVHSALTFLTNVPFWATPVNQPYPYALNGDVPKSTNIAFT